MARVTHQPTTEALPTHIAFMSVDKKSGPPAVTSRITTVATSRRATTWQVELITNGALATGASPVADARAIGRSGRRRDDNDIGSARAAATRTGDFVPMQSGSPAFGFWSNGPYAVAVCSGQGDSGTENWFSAGSDLVELVKTARDQDP